MNTIKVNFVFRKINTNIGNSYVCRACGKTITGSFAFFLKHTDNCPGR